MKPQQRITAHSKASVWLLAASLAFFAAGNTFSQVVTLTASDASGTSSFNTAGNWDSGVAPAPGDAYFTTNFTLRTPADANSYIFAGDSLSVDTNGFLAINGSGTITVNDGVLDGGTLQNAGTGATPDAATFNGSLNATNLLRADSFLNGGGSFSSSLNVQAPISGVGAITVVGQGTVLLSASNSFAGQLQVNSGTVKANNPDALPLSQASGDNIGNLRVNWVTNTAGNTNAIFDLNGFDVTANQFITGASNANSLAPTIINSVPGGTNTLTVGNGDGNGFTWRGVIRDNLGTGGKVAFAKIGSGLFSLSVTVNELSYSGDTIFAGGSVNLGNSLILPWGAGKGNLIVSNPCTLNMSGRSLIVNGFSGDGTIDDTGTTGRSTMNCGSNDVSSVFSGTIRDSQNNVPANQSIVSLAKFGAGTLDLTGNNSFHGPVTVSAGVLRITQSTGIGAVPKTGSNSISSATGDAQFHLLGTNGDIALDPGLSFLTAGTNGAIINEAGNNTIGGLILLQNGAGTTIRSDGGTLLLAGNISMVTGVTSRTLTLGGASSGTVGGIISDGSPATNILSLTKAGAGTWTLAGNNTYSGNSTISSGTLTLAASGSILNTTSILLQNNATLDVSAVSGWQLGANQTLSGGGNVNGNVTVNGTVSPGTSNVIGSIVFANQVTLNNATMLKLNRTNAGAKSDSLTAFALVRGGTLTVTNIGDPLQSGDTFSLLNGSLNGTFAATNLPALSGGLSWDTSKLGSQGVIKVASTAVAQPYLTSVTLSGSNLIISGTNGTAGQTFEILSSTNIASPLSIWTSVGTNTFGSGNFSVTNSVNPGESQRFYTVRVP
jgi:autotransporter-associated beta strand protein